MIWDVVKNRVDAVVTDLTVALTTWHVPFDLIVPIDTLELSVRRMPANLTEWDGLVLTIRDVIADLTRKWEIADDEDCIELRGCLRGVICSLRTVIVACEG